MEEATVSNSSAADPFATLEERRAASYAPASAVPILPPPPLLPQPLRPAALRRSTTDDLPTPPAYVMLQTPPLPPAPLAQHQTVTLPSMPAVQLTATNPFLPEILQQQQRGYTSEFGLPPPSELARGERLSVLEMYLTTALSETQHADSDMEDNGSSGGGGFNFRRTQSCRVPRSVSLTSLTFSQRSALVSSWRAMRPTSGALLRKIFLELEIACPKVKQIFYKAALVDAFNKEGENCATLEEHIRLVTKFFDDIIAVLDNEDEFRALIRRTGAVHAVLARSCAFGSDIWERLGEIAMERMCTSEATTKTREASRAWRILLACIVDELRGGFDEENRLVNRRSSSASDLPESLIIEDANTPLASGGICPVNGLQAQLRELRLQYNSTVPLQ